MRLLPTVLVLVLLAPCAALAQGDTRLAFLGRQLQQGKDPRTRSQAALVLGATEDPEAVSLLCGALKDASELVRAAAAKSLAKLLEPSGLACLQAHKGEADAAAKAAVDDAVAALKKLGVHGYRITPEIQATESGGLKVAIVCLTYPDLSLMGQVEVNAAGAQPPDLLKALVPKAVEEAAETFEWSSET